MLCAHDLEQGHDVRGGEEVSADDSIRSAGLGAHHIEVDCAGVGGEDAVRAARGLQIRKDLLSKVLGGGGEGVNNLRGGRGNEKRERESRVERA